MNEIPVYFINLESRLDKRHNIEKQLNFFNVKGIRIPGQRPKKNPGANLFVTAEVAGCWLAHKFAYKKVIDDNHQFALILEDDAMISKDFFPKLNSSLDMFSQKDIDLLQIGFVDVSRTRYVLRLISDFVWKVEVSFLSYLGTMKPLALSKHFSVKIRVRRALRTRDLSRQLQFGLLRPDDFKAGTHAYIVSVKFAQTLNQANDPIMFSSDQFLISLSKMCTFNIWRTTNNYSRQEGKFSSDIEGKRFIIYSN
jgi:GR25 family glycosyltransferase involved in LPS biosynthesis